MFLYLCCARGILFSALMCNVSSILIFFVSHVTTCLMTKDYCIIVYAINSFCSLTLAQIGLFRFLIYIQKHQATGLHVLYEIQQVICSHSRSMHSAYSIAFNFHSLIFYNQRAALLLILFNIRWKHISYLPIRLFDD